MNRAFVFSGFVLAALCCAAVSAQYSGMPATPVIDSMATDWRGKVQELDRRQAAVEHQLFELRREMGGLGSSVSQHQRELTKRMGTVEEKFEATLRELTAAQENPPSWLPALLEKQEERLAELTQELESVSAARKSTAVSSGPVERVPSSMHVHLPCGCPGELTLDAAGNWVLVEHHRKSNAVRHQLVVTDSLRRHYRVLATTSEGYRLTVGPNGAYEMVTTR